MRNKIAAVIVHEVVKNFLTTSRILDLLINPRSLEFEFKPADENADRLEHTGSSGVVSSNGNMASDSCAIVGIYRAVSRRAPEPESTGKLTRVVSNVFAAFIGLWPREAASRILCSVDIRWRLGSTRTDAKHQLLRRLEDTSVALRREEHGPATPPKKQTP